MFIKIEANSDGSHAFQNGGTLEPGWAFWNTDSVPVPASFPWVDIVVEDVTHSAITDGDKVLVAEYTRPEVISAVEREITESEPIHVETAEQKRITALESENKILSQQVAALSDQNDFQEELIVELANIVYA